MWILWRACLLCGCGSLCGSVCGSGVLHSGLREVLLLQDQVLQGKVLQMQVLQGALLQVPLLQAVLLRRPEVLRRPRQLHASLWLPLIARPGPAERPQAFPSGNQVSFA